MQLNAPSSRLIRIKPCVQRRKYGGVTKNWRLENWEKITLKTLVMITNEYHYNTKVTKKTYEIWTVRSLLIHGALCER